MALLKVSLLFCAFFSVIAQKPVKTKYGLKETGNEWWRSSPIYQIYPLSLKDSNNDGKGDLQGIISKLPYLKELGIGAVWISPIYPSPMVDFGYDISDFRGIHPWYGTMADFDQLVETMHGLGLKLIMDLVPNHSSDQHEWFLKSVNREGNYTDYYIWKDPLGFDENGDPIPPNNWLSVFRGSAWNYSDTRKQFYLHQFAAEQPDLNYRNPNVVQEMKDIILFWLKKGVDGFRIDAIPFLFESESFEDDPVHIPLQEDPLDYGYLDHYYSFGQDETFDMVQQWRALVDEQTEVDGIDRCLMVEAYTPISDTMRYYGTPERPGAHFPFNFQIIGTNNASTAQEVKRNIDTWFDNLPAGAQSNWVVGNHDQSRIGSKVGTDLADGMTILAALLPGISVTYYGEEIGMVNNDAITYEQGVDPQGCNYPPEQFYSRSRDFERTPFQWDDSVNAGFNTGAETWLPVNDNYKELNLEAQGNELYSHYTIYRDVRELDKLPVIQDGRHLVEVIGKGTLGLVRSLGSENFVVALVNFSSEPEQIDLNLVFLTGKRQLYVYTTTPNSGLEKSTLVQADNFTLAPRSSVVLTIPSST